MPPRRKPITERMLARTVTAASGCVEFTGARNRPGGYGVVVDADTRRPVLAHRIAWEATHGSIPDGLWVLHRCDNPVCVNVEHLFLGTVGDNNRDMVAKGRHGEVRKTRCPRGHEYTPDNIRRTTNGGRACRACEPFHRANTRRRKKAAAS